MVPAAEVDPGSVAVVPSLCECVGRVRGPTLWMGRDLIAAHIILGSEKEYRERVLGWL